MEGVTAGDSTDSSFESRDHAYSSSSFTNSERPHSDDDRSVASHDSFTSEQRLQWRKQAEAEMEASRRERMRETERH